MDFSLILFLLACATGLVWGVDHWLWAPARRRAAQEMTQTGGKEEAAAKVRKEPIFVEYARAFFPVILIVFLLRSFLVEPFRIPSGSMLPSLFIGDFILVNKFAYGARLPVLNYKVINIGAPKRGDVVVFRFPGDNSINYIKRVVGVPGDHVVYKDKKVYINGKFMEQTGGSPYIYPRSGNGAGNILRHTELLDGIKHDILITDRPDHAQTEFVVPEGQYFVMGDNRDHSNDSRYWGFVPDDNLVGKAFLIWFSWNMNGQNMRFWQRIIWNRIGNTIH